MDLTKPAELYDRDAEWRTLATAWEKPRADLVFCVGRRRVGKSFMLSRFARQVNGIYYQATRRTEAEQLAGLSALIGSHFDDPALQRRVAFPSWEDLFGYVQARADGQPFLLVLDEFPYLASAAPALPSVIQSLADHVWPGAPTASRSGRTGWASGGTPPRATRSTWSRSVSTATFWWVNASGEG